MVTFVAYTFFAIEALGDEIEEPFGTSPNDLALDAMSVNIEASVRELLGDRERLRHEALEAARRQALGRAA